MYRRSSGTSTRSLPRRFKERKLLFILAVETSAIATSLVRAMLSGTANAFAAAPVPRPPAPTSATFVKSSVEECT